MSSRIGLYLLIRKKFIPNRDLNQQSFLTIRSDNRGTDITKELHAYEPKNCKGNRSMPRAKMSLHIWEKLSDTFNVDFMKFSMSK